MTKEELLKKQEELAKMMADLQDEINKLSDNKEEVKEEETKTDEKKQDDKEEPSRPVDYNTFIKAVEEDKKNVKDRIQNTSVIGDDGKPRIDSFSDIYGGYTDDAVWTIDVFGNPVKIREAITVKGISEKEYEDMTDQEKDDFVRNWGLRNLKLSEYLYTKEHQSKLRDFKPTRAFDDKEEDRRESREYVNNLIRRNK